jgi:hypothetical protein
MPRKRTKVKKGFPRRKNKELPTKHKPRKAEKSKLLEQGFQKAIYAAATESEAEFNLELFAEKWDKQYPSISLDRNDCIEIVRIIHAARDVLQVLAEEDRVGAASMGTTIRSQKATYQGQRISQNLAQSAQS